MNDKQKREAVRDHYGSIAQRGGSCCSADSTCCGSAQQSGISTSQTYGYSAAELETIPEGSDMGLGCGNPLAFSSLKEGDIVRIDTREDKYLERTKS